MSVQHPIRSVYALGLGATFILVMWVWAGIAGTGYQWPWSLLGGLSLGGLIYGTAFSRWFHLHWIPLSQSVAYTAFDWPLNAAGLVWLAASGAVVVLLGLAQTWIVYHAQVEVVLVGSGGAWPRPWRALLARRLVNLLVWLVALLLLLVGLDRAGINVFAAFLSVLI